MTATKSSELLTVHGVMYEVGESVPRTPESILALESLRELVAVRRVTKEGKPFMVTTTKEPLIKPIPPSEEEVKENPLLLPLHHEAYDDYLRILKQQVEVPAAPAIGHLRTQGNPAYFYLRQIDTGITSVIPYATENQPEHMLFHLNIAEIVE